MGKKNPRSRPLTRKPYLILLKLYAEIRNDSRNRGEKITWWNYMIHTEIKKTVQLQSNRHNHPIWQVTPAIKRIWTVCDTGNHENIYEWKP